MNIICCCVLCRWSHLTLKFLWNSHYYYYRWGLWNGTKGKNISWGSLSDVPGTMLSESERVAQSCLTLWHPMDCSPPGSSIHGILQARILGWVAIPFSRGSSQPMDRTWVFCIAGIFNASNTSPSFVTTKNVSRHYQMFPYRRQGNSTNYCMIVYWPHSFCNWSHFPFILLYMYGRKKLDKCDSSLLSCFGF